MSTAETRAVPGTSRDTRIDWLRGLALVMIFINHMPGNRFENWTNRNFGFSDAAEIFVLLAGVAAAFAYFKKYAAGDIVPTYRRIGQRVWTLYLAHVASTLAAVALFAFAAVWYGNPDVLDLIGIAPLFSDPLPGLVGIATGGHQLGFFNILPLYVVLLSTLPIMMWLAARDIRLLLAASFALYMVAHLLGWSVPNFPTDGSWFFNPFLWQFLFAIGLSLGIMKMRGQWVAYNPIVWWSGLSYLLFSAVWTHEGLGGTFSDGQLPTWVDGFHKSYLPLPRLMHVLALAYVFVHSPLWPALTRVAAADRVFVTMGQNSLPAFVAGSLASMVGYILLVHAGSDLVLEIALVLTGVATMWVVAAIAENGLSETIQATQRRLRGILLGDAATSDDDVRTPAQRPAQRK